MIIQAINKIKKLSLAKYNYKRDKTEITELYHIVSEHCPDREKFIALSASTMKLLRENKLNDTNEKQWLNYANTIFASHLAVKMYDDKSIISSENLNQVVDYYRNGGLSEKIVSIGLYACSQMMNSSAPMQCYELTKEAFLLNPYLSNTLNIDYCYEGKATEENLTTECPICNKKGAVPYYCSPQVLKLNQKDTFPPSKLWMKCNHCNNYYTYNFPIMSVGEINGHYTKNSDNIIPESRFPLHLYNNIFTKLRTLSSGKEYLEIGIGNGEMLAVAQEFGYHVEAIEICKQDCENVSAVLDVDIKWCDVADFESQKQYDVIIMGDVFEHILHPGKVLEKIKGMLNDNGILWLSTPNYNCAYARMQKFNHCMWHELNHYTYVSFETMKELLQNLGMEIIDYNISERYMGSMELFIRKSIYPKMI